MMDVALKSVKLPDFGSARVEPAIPGRTYNARVNSALARAQAQGLDALVVYADREHSATMSYLTKFDPRFEEAMLILTPGRQPALLLGNECWGYADISPVPLRKVLFQHFSLLGQARDGSDTLDKIFKTEGIKQGSTVGVVGWKYFEDANYAPTKQMLEIPAYIVDILRSVTGNAANVVNATDIFMNATDGLRIINDVDQLAVFEYAATAASNAVKRVLFGARPGMTEYEAMQLMQINGMPWSCYGKVLSGKSTTFGMQSPSSNRLKRGDRFKVTYGVWGALNCRAGFLVASAAELPADIRDYLDKLVKPYFRAIVEWYRAVGLGVEGGLLFDLVHRHVGDPFFGVTLNPGHQIHLDEWVNSPIFLNSKIPLRSGMALQADVIPATGTKYFTTNIEDGIALADEKLRKSFAAKYPEAWRRIQARRKFMAKMIGIELKPEVLPFSNIPAYLPPFILKPEMAMTVCG
jgi:hypothetical protein